MYLWERELPPRNILLCRRPAVLRKGRTFLLKELPLRETAHIGSGAEAPASISTIEPLEAFLEEDEPAPTNRRRKSNGARKPAARKSTAKSNGAKKKPAARNPAAARRKPS